MRESDLLVTLAKWQARGFDDTVRVVQSWEHETRKPRVSCFVYIDTNTRTQNQNTKQT